MKMINSKSLGVRSQLFAVAIFFSISATTQAAELSSDSTAEIIESDSADTTFNDTDIVELDDALGDIEPKDFLARVIDSINGKFINTIPFVSNESSTVGVKVHGSNNTVIQSGNIILTGDNSVGVVLNGTNNLFTLAKGATISSLGLDGKGILIDGGKHLLNIDGNIFAAGNALEFGDNSLVNEFNLSGNIQGGDNAILIGDKSFVRNVNLNTGAAIIGDIKSLSERVTNFNVNTDFSYDGNILGADNINLRINDGTMKFSGAAEVLSVDIGTDAKLFGGTFTAKNFVNHGTIGAGSPDTNLIINGDLVSDGFIQKTSGGLKGLIIVNGHANIDGSTVTTDSLLPNETATVLVAESISGKIKNPEGSPVPISAMLNATGSITDNRLTVTTYEANNLGKLNAQEKETFDAMNNMFDTLDNVKQNEMRELYNLPTTEAKQTLSQISSNDSAQIMSVAQQNTAVDKMIANRVTHIFAPNYIDMPILPMNFADSDDASAVTVTVKVPTRQENNFWLNFMKNWGNLRGGTDYHGSVIVGGYDRSIGDKWRAGIFATYGTIGYGADSSRATVYDTRLGFYAGCHNRASDIYFYVNGGQLRNSLHRGLSSLGLMTNAKYKSRIVEVGGEYKYDLQPKRTWHVSPFINAQTSHLRQDGYNEHGAGIYNQHVDARSNTYFAAQVGLDLKRWYRKGMFGLRFGVKHGFTGVDPELKISYAGDGNRNYRLRQQRDKTHFVFSLRGENEFARGWFMYGETELQLSENDKDVTASLMLRRTW